MNNKPEQRNGRLSRRWSPLVALFYDSLGKEGMVWLFAGCYGLAALLTLAFRPTDERTRTNGQQDETEEKNLVSTLSTRGTSNMWPDGQE